MKNPWFIVLRGVIAMLLLAGCSGEDYDPSASGSDHAAIQGKAIQEPPASQPLASIDPKEAKPPVQDNLAEGKVTSIEETSGESDGSIEINTLAASGSKKDPSGSESIEETSGESVGSIEINTLAASSSKKDSSGSESVETVEPTEGQPVDTYDPDAIDPNVDDTVVAENAIDDDRSPVTASVGATNPLVGQTLPSIDPAIDTGVGDAGEFPAPKPQNSQLPPLPKDSPYKEVSFRALSSFPYDVEWATDGKEPDPSAFLQRVPREVRKLSGAKVAVEGFMIPTMVNEENKVTEFLLLPDQMSCCYGKNPAANGWVVVNAKGIDIMMDKIIRVTGSMFVEERWDEEFFEGLYHLTCEKVTGPAL